MAVVTYVPDAVGLFALTRAPAGPVGMDLEKRGLQLQRLAQRQANKKTGFLRVSIGSRLTLTSTGLMVTVGSSARHALIHHNGTRAHVITPKRAGALRFSSGGRIVYARKVMHPGTRPNRYLTDNLYRVVLR